MMVEDKILNFEKMGLGLFIHWGLYAHFAEGEWAQNILEVPNYSQAFTHFNPDPKKIRQWVTLAKQNGFKYIVLTAKHHDGFCLFDTKGISEFDSMHTPFKADVIKIFVDECHRQGIAPFLYFVTYDWHNLKYTADFPGYLAELLQLIRLLATNYGEIGGFWFDGNWDKPDADWQTDQLYSEIRQLQPQAMITNNTGLEQQGVNQGEAVDVLTFERGNPQNIKHEQHGRYFAAETSMTLNRHWGNAENDLDYVAARQLIEQICQSRKVGANLLINIGPQFDGSIDLPSQALLELVGKWMRVNGTAITATANETHPTYIAENNDKNFIKGDYLFVTGLQNIGNHNVVLGGEQAQEIIFQGQMPQRKIKQIVWLDNGQSVDFQQSSDELKILADSFRYGTHLVVRVAQITFVD